MYCFTVGITNCLRSNPCCTQDLIKLEFDVVPQCVGSVVYSITDGVQRPAQYQLKPYPTVKVNQISKRFLDVPGTQICLLLRPPCATISQLCGRPNGCTYALFNKRTSDQPKCCPVRNIDDPLGA